MPLIYGGTGIGASSIRALEMESSSEFDLRMESYLWQEVSFLRILERLRSNRRQLLLCDYSSVVLDLGAIRK